MTKLFYLQAKTIHQRPRETSRIEENGSTKVTTAMGFPICTISQYVEGEDVLGIFNEHATFSKRINDAIQLLSSQIDGGEECRGRDGEISEVIRILSGENQ